jgi:hypothetical protein
MADKRMADKSLIFVGIDKSGELQKSDLLANSLDNVEIVGIFAC